MYALTIHESLLSDASGNPARNWGNANEMIEVSIAIMNAAIEVTASVNHELLGITTGSSFMGPFLIRSAKKWCFALISWQPYTGFGKLVLSSLKFTTMVHVRSSCGTFK